jgi:hypothetical protein
LTRAQWAFRRRLSVRGATEVSRHFPPVEPKEETKTIPALLPVSVIRKLDEMVEWQAALRDGERVTRMTILRWLIEQAYRDDESEMREWQAQQKRKRSGK